MRDWRRLVRDRLAQHGFTGPIESEIAEELAYHLERRYAELLGTGMDEPAARAAAIAELDGKDWIETARRMRRERPAPPPLGEPRHIGGIMSGTWHDVKLAWRSIRTRPGFSLLVIGMLALGVAGNAAIFSIFNGLFLKPFPFDHPERLVDVDETAPQWDLKYVGVSNFDQDLWRRGNRSFEEIGFFTGSGGNLAAEGAVQRIRGAQVTWNLLDVFHLKPAAGRNFRADEDKPGAPYVVMLGYTLWRQAFHGDRTIVGRVVKISERPYTVVGVLPAEAVLPDQIDAWMPLRPDLTTGGGWYLSGVGRLRPGVTMERARADLLRVHRSVEDPPRLNHLGQITSPVLTPLRDRYLGGVRTAGVVLLVAVAAVLLIACVNVAALMMVRGSSRTREIAIRTAMGASRGRIIAQLITESGLMAVIAGVLGVAGGAGLLKLMTPLMPSNLPRWLSFQFDARFALFCIAITGAAAILFAVLPAVQSSRVPARAALQESGTRTTMSRRRTLTLRGLVVAEIAMALALLVGAGLVLQGFQRVSQIDPGFRPEGLLTFSVALPALKYNKPELTLGFFNRLVDELRVIPGVQSAAATTAPPLGGHTGNFWVVEGAPEPGPKDKNPVVLTVWSTPSYLETLGIGLLGGRYFTPSDDKPNQPLAIVNRTFVKQFWPALKNPGEAAGRRIRYTGTNNPWVPVAGVVGDEKHYGLDEDMKPAVYLLSREQPRTTMALVIRAAVDPQSLVAPAREALHRIDPDLPMIGGQLLTDRLRDSLWVRRGSTWLFGAFALVALVLAAAGIYGVVSFAVSQRTHEIGIRMALGARPEWVLAEVLRGGMTMVALGVALGLATAWFTAQVLGTLLFGVSARDLAVYVSVTAGVLLVGLLANVIPARRAAHVDPMRALRA